MVRVALLGTGPEAGGFARALGAAGGAAALMGVHGPGADAPGGLAAAWGVQAFADRDALLRLADVAIVASGPERRGDDAERAVQLGLDVLTAPLDAATLRALQGTAARAARHPVLGVAHDAVHDPAFRALRRLVGDGAVIAVEATHLEPFDDGPGHADVTADLVLGPLQCVLAIAGRPPSATQAAARRVRRAQGVDHVTATLCFDDDLIAVVTAGRAGMRRVHRVVVETPLARVTADLAAGTVEAERDLPGHGVVTERPVVHGADARSAHLAAFLRACREQRPADVGVGVTLGLLDVAEAVRRRAALVAQRPARAA